MALSAQLAYNEPGSNICLGCVIDDRKFTIHNNIHCVSNNVPFYIEHNSANNEPIFIIFGVQDPEKISDKKL